MINSQIDKIISEKLFGIDFTIPCKGLIVSVYQSYACSDCGALEPENVHYKDALPYSNDMTLAFRVVERVTVSPEGHTIGMFCMEKIGKYRVGFGYTQKTGEEMKEHFYEAEHESPSMGICLAALKVLGVSYE
jgi:hypothetical protein